MLYVVVPCCSEVFFSTATELPDYTPWYQPHRVVCNSAGDELGCKYGRYRRGLRVYESGSWGQQGKLTAVTGASGDQFGFFVGLSGDTAVVGVPQDDDAGSAYTFVASGGGVEA